MPRAPPITASSTDSTSALRTSRRREAPSAIRIEVWARSFNPRASIRFARFPQATNNTQPAATNSSFSPS